MTDTTISNAEFLLKKIQESDAILEGASSGFSAADGKRFWYEDDDEFKKCPDGSENGSDRALHSIHSILHTDPKKNAGPFCRFFCIISTSRKPAKSIKISKFFFRTSLTRS